MYDSIIARKDGMQSARPDLVTQGSECECLIIQGLRDVLTLQGKLFEMMSFLRESKENPKQNGTQLGIEPRTFTSQMYVSLSS